MMIQRRLFSTTPVALAKRKQLAIKRKKANIQRQKVLQAERSPIDFDPIVGKPTEFTRSLLTPAKVWSSADFKDSLYFTGKRIETIQAAIETAMHNRVTSEPMQSFLPGPSDSANSLPMKVPKSLDAYDAEKTKSDILAEKLKTLTIDNETKSAASSRIMSLNNANTRTLRAYNTALALKAFARSDGDTGSAEVQAAVLTTRILAEHRHIQANKKDVHGFRGFRGLVHQRQKMLKYLRKEDVERYFKCIDKLGLPDAAITREITM